MKRTVFQATFSALAALLMLVSSCSQEKDYTGTEVQFLAGMDGVDTRTQYVTGGESNNRQYIDWVTGDEFKVLMSATSASAKYTIGTHGRVDSNPTHVDRSTNVSLSSGETALTWGSANTYFYAVYPASAVNSFTSSIMTGTVPSTVSVPAADVTTTGSGSSSVTTIAPAVSSAYFFAKTSSVAPRADAVNLLFDPGFTAYQFTLQNTSSSAVSISSVTLKSDGHNALSGPFTLTWSSWARNNPGSSVTPDSPVASTSESIVLNFPSAISVPANGGQIVFTFIGLPVSQNDLSLTVNGLSLKLESSANTYIIFAACKLHKVAAIALPSMQFLEAIGTDITWKN